MNDGPLEGIDEAAASENSAKLTEALERARTLALARDFDAAQREIDPWLLSTDEDPDRTDDLIQRAADPKAMATAIAKARAVYDPAGLVGLKPVSEFAGDLPPSVLWMDARKGGGNVLRVGDVALLSGAGGSGKSFVSLALAVAAACDGNEKHGDACGLHVRKGPAVVLSYEDDPNTVAWRCGLIASSMADPGSAPENVLVIPDPDPLMVADYENPGKAAESEQWVWLWKAIRSKSPSVVIIDPASAALAGVNQNDGATVRRFLRALAKEGKEGGFGVLVVAHSTKAGRFGQEDVGPHAVAGSGQWMDASRGVLLMRGQGSGRAVIECVKSNHGPVGWAVELEADMRRRSGNRPDRFAGWKRFMRYSPEGWMERKKQRKEDAASKKVAPKKAEKKTGRLSNRPWSWRKSRAEGNGEQGPPHPDEDAL